MIPRNRIILASLIVGSIGAIIAGLWSYWLWQNHEISGKFITFPVGIISGFLSCFFISIWYLRFMEYKSWGWGVLFGLLFAGLAGAISGVITGTTTRGAMGGIIWGVIVGGSSGVLIGLMSSLVYGASRALRNE